MFETSFRYITTNKWRRVYVYLLWFAWKIEFLQPACLVVVEKQEEEEREKIISEIVNVLAKEIIADSEKFFEKLSELFHIKHNLQLEIHTFKIFR